MKRIALLLLISQLLLFLIGCSGTYNESLNGKFEDGQTWIEQSHNIFFVCDNTYYTYENSHTSSVGQVTTDDGNCLFFNVVYDNSGNLFFYPLGNEDNQEYYFMGYFKSADENTYSVKVDYSRVPEIVPDGTKLTFCMSDTDTMNPYIPEYLGRQETRDTAGHGDGS